MKDNIIYGSMGGTLGRSLFFAVQLLTHMLLTNYLMDTHLGLVRFHKETQALLFQIVMVK